jgi:hypothetical protein
MVFSCVCFPASVVSHTILKFVSSGVLVLLCVFMAINLKHLLIADAAEKGFCVDLHRFFPQQRLQIAQLIRT